MLVFSVVSCFYQPYLEIARQAKKIKPDIKVVFGGIHATAVPEIVINQPEVDYVVIGEGDIAFLKILEAVQNKDFEAPIQNTWFKNPKGDVIKGIQEGFIQNLDELPSFDKTPWEEHMRVGDIYYTMTSRGCPFRCTFCCNDLLSKIPEKHEGAYLRRRSVDHVMQELRTAHSKYKLNWIFFIDDVFTFNKDWLREFAQQYKNQIGVRFHCYTHPAFFDEEVCEILKSAGCEWMTVGIQTLDEGLKKEYLNRRETNQQIIDTIKIIKKFKIKLTLDFIIGFPKENIENLEITRNFLKQYTPNIIQVFYLNMFPGTKLLSIYHDEKIISDDVVDKINNGNGNMLIVSGHHENIQGSFNMKQQKSTNKTYFAYTFIFMLLPLMPKWVRKYLTIKSVRWIPSFFLQKLRLVSEISGWIIMRDFRAQALLKHTRYYIARAIRLKFGFKFDPATKVKKQLK